MTFILAGATYSENVGDGVIAECLAWQLKQLGMKDIIFWDIAGRTGYGHRIVRHKGAAMAWLESLPVWLRPLVVGLAVVGMLLKGPVWRWWHLIQRGDVVIIGGGQLLQDINLNFPIKLFCLALLARLKGANVALYAVGVGNRWSWPARWMFGYVVRACQGVVMVRDEESRLRLATFLKMDIPIINVVPDPGLLAAGCYPDATHNTKNRPKDSVGLNLSAPRELAMYVHQDIHLGVQHVSNIWLGFIEALVAEGRQIVIFTNGAEEDNAYASNIYAQAIARGLRKSKRNGKPRIAPYATT